MTHPAWILLALSACGGTSLRSSPNTQPSTAAVPAPLYAGLFVRGAKLRYEFERRDSFQDEPETSSKGTTTCTVTDVQHVAGAIAAEVTCDGAMNMPEEDAGPEGVYVATPEGLWRVEGMPDAAKVKALVHDDMLMGAIPVEYGNPLPRVSHGTNVGLTKEADGLWCWSRSSTGGDESDATICIRRGVIVSGAGSFAGGSSHEVTYGLAK